MANRSSHRKSLTGETGVAHHVERRFVLEASHGPLPSPEALSRYEAICPGLADRIVSMAEEESKHRRERESKILSAQIHDAEQERIVEKRGQWFGFFIGIASMIFSYSIFRIGHQYIGSIFGSCGILGLVAVFVYGRYDVRMREKESHQENHNNQNSENK